MRKILILGSGAGGTIVANMLRKELSESEWEMTIIDRKEHHHYQAGYLFIPFGVYGEQDVLKPKKEFISGALVLFTTVSPGSMPKSDGWKRKKAVNTTTTG